MNSFKITDIPFWENYETRIRNLFLNALVLLRNRNFENIDNEDSISIILLEVLRDANDELNKHDDGLDSLPVFNAPYQAQEILNQYLEEPLKVPKPDFQIELHDYFAIRSSDKYLYYVIECKRIGIKHANNNLCNDYVTEGIDRYTETTHYYGINCPSGIMIGYIQNSNYLNILNEITKVTEKKNIEKLRISNNQWPQKGLVELSHMLIRTYPMTPFKLIHLWISLKINHE